jgi:electron transfer flavoprotein alpha/beta subunit
MITLAELGIETSAVGSASARQEILSVEDGPTRTQGRVIVDDGTSQDEILALLVDAKII